MGGHGGHHGGAWKVAYADFVTAMMAFFLVMWLLGADEETRAAIAHYFNHPNTPYKAGADPSSKSVHPMGEKEGEGESLLSGQAGMWPEDLVERPGKVNEDSLKDAASITKLIEEMLEGKVYGVEKSANQVKFSLPSSILFKPGSSDISDEAVKTLHLLGNVLQNFKGHVKIVGHADDNPSHEPGKPFHSNWQLSMDRAVTVMSYFVEARKMDENKFIPIGAGARFPLVPNTTPENRARNRRVEFTLVYDPGTDK